MKHKEESEWYEQIPEHGVLCWVAGQTKLAAIILRKVDDKFVDTHSEEWLCAIPLTNEEIDRFKR